MVYYLWHWRHPGISGMQEQAKSSIGLFKFSRAETALLAALAACLLVFVSVRVSQRHRPAGAGLEVTGAPALFPHKIELNSSSADQLRLVPGIGEARARKIVEERGKNGGFKGVGDLAKINGFTEKLVDALKCYVYVGSASQSEAQ